MGGSGPELVSCSSISDLSPEMFVVIDDNALAREFVSFCLERRGHKWPELYDEMCRVASYRLFRDMGYRELNDHGVSLSLLNMDTLAALADNLASSRTSCQTS
jgi:hypothetical protein